MALFKDKNKEILEQYIHDKNVLNAFCEKYESIQLIDIHGESVDPIVAFNIRPHAAIVCEYRRGHNYWGIVDMNGEVIIPIVYDKIKLIENLLFEEKNVVLLKKDNNFTITRISSRSNYIEDKRVVKNWDVNFELISEQNRFVFGFKDQLVHCFCDGIDIFECEWFEHIGDFSEGLFPVQKKGKWGFINMWGTLIIQCQYEQVRGFKNGFAGVKLGNKWGLIDNAGNLIINFQHELIFDCSEGLIGCVLNKRLGFINLMGEVVIPFHYGLSKNDNPMFVNGMAPVRIKSKGLVGYVYINRFNQQISDYVMRHETCYEDIRSLSVHTEMLDTMAEFDGIENTVITEDAVISPNGQILFYTGNVFKY